MFKKIIVFTFISLLVVGVSSKVAAQSEAEQLIEKIAATEETVALQQLPNDTVKVRLLYEYAERVRRENNRAAVPIYLKAYNPGKQLHARKWIPKIE